MKEKIEHQDTSRITEFSPLFIQGLIITTFATLFLVFSSFPYYGPYREAKSFLAPPQIIASGIMVAYAITEFQGGALEDVTLQSNPDFFIILMVEFVLLPLCFLYSWRFLFLKKSQQTGSEGKPKNHIVAKSLFGISGVLILYLILGNIISAFTSPRIYQTMILDNAVDQNRNAVIAQLSRIGYKANEYFALPKNLGGGRGNYYSKVNGTGKMPVSLNELSFPKETAAGKFSSLKTINDYTIVFKGIGSVSMSDGSYPTYEMWVSPVGLSPKKIN